MAHFPTNDGRMPWRASVLTLFPEMFPGPLGLSLVGQALAVGLWTLNTHQIRDFGLGRHAQVDDTPAGGGAGMVLRADVLGPAIDHARAENPNSPVIYLSPRGRTLDQNFVRELSAGPGVVLLSGRFEGIDERIIAARAMQEVSIGDYVLSGGDLAAMVLIDACVRLIPGVLGKSESAAHESFEDGLLEHPHYTKPREWEGHAIPDVLLSGDHKKIAEWRRQQALELTEKRRPDLIAKRRGKIE